MAPTVPGAHRAGPAGGWRWASLGIFALTAVAVVLVSGETLDRAGLPDYGTWTGVRPLEAKLRLLSAFARSGPIDALVLGSSLTDHGFSAEHLSETMSAGLGRPYRAFNFSTGASEWLTLPRLYRLARTVARPRYVLAVIPPQYFKRPNAIPPASPDAIMLEAPVGRTLPHPWLLSIDKAFWDFPVVRYASPVRDLVMYGKFASLQGQGSDLYAVNEHGDRLNYGQVQDVTLIQGIRQLATTGMIPLSPEQEQQLSLDERLDYYFSQLDIDGIKELKALTEADGAELILVETAAAGIFFERTVDSPAYFQVVDQQFRYLSEMTGATRAPPVRNFAAPAFAVADVLHLNHYGALMFTDRVAQGLLNGTDQPQTDLTAGPWQQPGILPSPTDDPTMNTFAAVIVRRDATEGKTLRLRYVRNHAVPPMPVAELFVGLRLSRGQDLIAPGRQSPDGQIEATFDDLPDDPKQVFFGRLLMWAGGRAVALNQPLAQYTWSTTVPRRPDLQVVGNGLAGQALSATWSDLATTASDGTLGLFKAGGMDEPVVRVPTTLTPSGQAEVAIPGATPPGRYELRLYATGRPDRLATSAPFSIAAP